MSNSYFALRRGVAFGAVLLIAAKALSTQIVGERLSKSALGQLQGSVAALFVSIVLAGALYGVLSGMAMEKEIRRKDVFDVNTADTRFWWIVASVLYLTATSTVVLYIVFSKLHIPSSPTTLLWYGTYGAFTLCVYHLLRRIGISLKRHLTYGKIYLSLLSLLNIAYCVYELDLGFRNSPALRVLSPSGPALFALVLDALAAVFLFFIWRLLGNEEYGPEIAYERDRERDDYLEFPWGVKVPSPEEDVQSTKIFTALLGQVKTPLRVGVILSVAASSNLILIYRTIVTVVLVMTSIATGVVAFTTRQGVLYLVPIATSYLGAQLVLWPYRSLSRRETLLFRLALDVGKLERKILTVLGVLYLAVFLVVEAVVIFPRVGLYNYLVVALLSISLSFGSIFAAAVFVVTNSPSYLDITRARSGGGSDAVRFVLKQCSIGLVACSGAVSLVQFHSLGNTRSFLLESTISVVAFSLILPLAASSWIGRREYGLQRATLERKKP